jgi:glycine dehydrogenase subunit 2
MHQFSLMPSAGAHGELAALLMAKKYFADLKQPRDIVLVPDSAHGTNPASATMAGFDTITIKSLADGDVDLNHLQEIISKYSERIAVFMLTNPSTLGLFVRNITEVVSIIHKLGGLMYYDGANLNAIAGIVRPGDMGFDLLHLNLHKTFSTPHGGGGPGAGPVGAAKHLAAYLPGKQVNRDDNGKLYWSPELASSIGRIRAFHGNFNVLLRALAYIKRNGAEGIKRIAETATLNANYIQQRIRTSAVLANNNLLVPYFNRTCKHEFIISAARMKEVYNVSALDIAKRLLDHGIHSPTIYFPLTVPECIMIEPTETESRAALDSLIVALESIITEAQTEEGRAAIKAAPETTELARFDEVKAVRNPLLTAAMERKCANNISCH